MSTDAGDAHVVTLTVSVAVNDTVFARARGWSKNLHDRWPRW